MRQMLTVSGGAGQKTLGGVLVSVVPKRDRGALGVQVRFRVDDVLARRISAVCEETGRHQSDVIRHLLEAGLEAYEREKRKR